MSKASAHSSSTPECQQLAQLLREAPQRYCLANTTLCGAHTADVSSSACLQGEGKVLQLLLETQDPCRAEAGIGFMGQVWLMDRTIQAEHSLGQYLGSSGKAA